MTSVTVFAVRMPEARQAYHYSVSFNGEPIVTGSCDPECDAARALLALGITGKAVLFDGNTGKPRTVINIERAAKLRVSDESRDGLRFRKHARNPDNSRGTAESTSPVDEVAEERSLA